MLKVIHCVYGHTHVLSVPNRERMNPSDAPTSRGFGPIRARVGRYCMWLPGIKKRPERINFAAVSLACYCSV